jgi:hypothetical protein
MDNTSEVLRRISVSNKGEIFGGFRKLPVKSCIICTIHQIILRDKIKENGIDGVCSMHESDKNAYKISARKSEGKILLET